MKALVLTGRKTLVREEAHKPAAGPNEAVLRVESCLLCRTDAKMWEKGQRDLVLPRVPGHEICAVDDSTGDSFVVWPGLACGTCPQCTGGYENLCPHMQILGFNRDGGLAEHILVRREALIPVKDDLPPRVAALAEPTACCLNALNQVGVRDGERLLIFGAGPMGLLTAVAALDRGAVPAVFEKNPEKLSRSREFREATRVDARTTMPAGDFDVCINAVSALDTFAAGISRLRAGGRFCVFSGFPGQESVSVEVINEMHYRQLQVAGAYGCTRADMIEALIVLGKIRESVCLLIESRITLDEVPSVMERIAAGQALKIEVRPSDTNALSKS